MTEQSTTQASPMRQRPQSSSASTNFGMPNFGIMRQAMANVSRDTNNFKVVVRVRPPLKRELPPRGEKDDDGLTIKFRPITEISMDQKVLTLMEYVG